jgi:hypothetical protein
MAMLKSDVATGRFMNGAEMCMVYRRIQPVPAPSLLNPHHIQCLRGLRTVFRFQEFPRQERRAGGTRKAPLKNPIGGADKNYRECNLIFIGASHYLASAPGLIQFLDGSHRYGKRRPSRTHCARNT